MSGCLHSRTGKDCALQALLDSVRTALSSPDPRAVGLFYTPRVCTFAILSDQGLKGPPGASLGTNGSFQEAVTAQAYEARLFHSDWEVRWLRQGRNGRVAVLWEGEDETPADTPLADLKGLSQAGKTALHGTIDQQYLLWGSPASRDGEWVKLTGARIGTLWAPIAGAVPSDKARAVLRSREYLQTLAHGNVCVVEERLIGLDWDTGDNT